MKKQFLLVIISLSSIIGFSQVQKSSEIFKVLKSKDSLLFNIGFNTCDISQFENLVSGNFEFYHDTAGITNSKSDFVSMFRDGVCKMSYKAIRKLDKNSLEVFVLKKNGEVYGAIQNGIHRFYALEKNKPKYFTSIAKFTNVWILENDEWKLSRSLSYDHQTKDK
ncbi:MAG: nuclear transport factor 2 family protein [Oceanihabitans sp.]